MRKEFRTLDPVGEVHRDGHATDLLPCESNSGNRWPQPPRQRRRNGTLAIGLAVAGALTVGGVATIHWARHGEKPITIAAPVPVTETAVGQSDVPITYEGLGTVQAYNTVSVRTQVDGQIVAINFREGQEVHAGDVLAQVDPRSYLAQLQAAKAKLVQDEYQLENSRLDLRRYSTLVRTDDATDQQVATQQAQVGTQEGLVEADKAQIDSAQVSLSYTTIRSPITGRTGIRQVDIGNIVHTTDSTPIVVVTQLQPVSVLFTLPEQDLAAIQAQQDAQVSPLTVVALDGQSGTIVDRGTLQLVDNEIDQTTGTIKLKAEFPNAKNRLWPGEFVTTRLVLEIRHNGMTLPARAIQNGPDGTFVFVIGDDHRVTVQPVKVAQIEQNIALIDRGVQPHQRVVLDGQSRLEAGTPVTMVPPAVSTQ